jgi:mannose-6-phosphate isomerase
MSNKNKLFRLTGKVQHYQWGGFDYIPHLLGLKNEQHQPFAEYWLGAHNNAPSQLENGETLNQYLSQHPDALGEKLQTVFGRLPYLLKILDVKDMLSIQVHPAKKAAELEFAKENEKGIALNDPGRNYKDDNHKPELMLALGEFWLLHGFRKRNNLLRILDEVPEFRFLVPVFEKQGYKGLYELIMTLPQNEVNTILHPLLNRVIPAYHSRGLQKNDPGFWAARAALTFNRAGKIDRGIFSVYLLNLVCLKRGEAIFQDAGILHAYLEGQNVEIMANSDNVLRGGLTPKHIDVHELMKHVVFEPVEPVIIAGIKRNPVETVFPTPAPDFELSRILLSGGQEFKTLAETATVFLSLKGKAEISGAEEKININAGEAFIGFAGAGFTITAASDTELFKAAAAVR